MHTIDYNKNVSEVTLSKIHYQILRVLAEGHNILAADLLFVEYGLPISDADQLVATISKMDDLPWSYTITYPEPAQLAITDAEWGIIHSLYKTEPPRKVVAIKFLKEQYNLRLKAAKDICDHIGAN